MLIGTQLSGRQAPVPRTYLGSSGICVTIALLASLEQGLPRVLTMANRVGVGHQFSGTS